MLMTADVEILDALYHAKAAQDVAAEERAIIEQGTALLVRTCVLCVHLSVLGCTMCTDMPFQFH